MRVFWCWPFPPRWRKRTKERLAAEKPESAAKTGEKPEAGSKKPAKPVGTGGYATESEARAHCKGEVVWVDEHHFNHYPGSREYGRKPGAFVCEKG